MLARASLPILTVLGIGLPLIPQESPKAAVRDAEISSAVAEAIREWVREYEHDKFGPKGLLRSGMNLQPRYVEAARRADRVTQNDYERCTHLDMLQKLLFFAESQPSAELADAVLGLCATGLEGTFLDHEALMLRELGHWCVMRMNDHGAWWLVLRAAAGERVPVLGAQEQAAADEHGLTVGPARRVAALRLIGGKGLPVFRGTLEAALADADPRVRLAAAESMSQAPRQDSLRKVVARLERERHGAVSQALVRLLLSQLRAAKDLDPVLREEMLARALEQFGQSGWRTDMDLLDLVDAFPHKAAIPVLIEALDLQAKTPDALVEAINKRASPLLRERAATLLRQMTGAMIQEDAKAWKEFWEREKDHIVVPTTLAKNRPETTRASFFGLQVTGSAVGFLIDTSGSMEDAPSGTVAATRKGRGNATRLGAAKEQIVVAVQAMPPDSTYSLFTFADRAHAWTSVPVKPTPHTMRSLTELLSRLQPKGATNLFDGLATALQLREQRYGERVTTRIDELFVLSDGEPTAGQLKDGDLLLQVVREANRYAKVRINTVFTGVGEGADLLRRLAEENGGVFVQR
ncbi:MAG TPA: VWA domain-containing protein [Planctomycetota bacterium]|nr:VWA domain-containing protein [Planctomycetota bacterium]